MTFNLTRALGDANATLAGMTPEQKREHWLEQRRSWVVGEMLLAHPEMTREKAQQIYDMVTYANAPL